MVLIILLFYAANQSWLRVGVVLLALPFSLIGGFWFLGALDYNVSLAVWVGIIALLGVDAETGQVRLLYLETTYERYVADGRLRTAEDLLAAIHEGTVQRIRPTKMTVATDRIGLLPLVWATGTGADVTRPAGRAAGRRHRGELRDGAAGVPGGVLPGEAACTGAQHSRITVTS